VVRLAVAECARVVSAAAEARLQECGLKQGEAYQRFSEKRWVSLRSTHPTGFTKEHGVKQLVYFEEHATAMAAIQRAKNIKHWSRKWKIDLVMGMNPEWRDLYDDIVR
jgi:predicted GIY-YIG superfamily endonuclease